MAFVTTGLPNNGNTTHFHVEYDDTLDTTVGEAIATQLMNACDGDFDLMNGWFGNIGSPWSGRMTVRIQAGNESGGGIGASWSDLSSPITLVPGIPAEDASASPNLWLLRYLLVSEVVEMFMDSQGKGWFGGTWDDSGNEGSAGEGLSRFLGAQFLLENGQGVGLIDSLGFNIAFTWLQSSARADFVNHVNPEQNGFVPEVGCAILFIYYLFTQLGFTIEDIVAAGARELSTVYKTLTGDSTDPFPYFKQMLDVAFPGTNTITSGNLDNPYPLGSMSFWGVKNTYGRDEVADIVDSSGGRYQNAFWLALDGFNVEALGLTTPTLPTIAFPGATTELSPAGIALQSSNPKVPQRIMFPYDVLFTSATEGAFPTAGETPAAVFSEISLDNTTLQATTEFFFTPGADPYFTNVQASADPNQDNVFWLSQDLRVFTATPGLNLNPVTGGPPFDHDTVDGAYIYLQDLLRFLNHNYGDPSGTDPFDVNNSILPGQTSAYTGDSSVTPGVGGGVARQTNYNFALARVRLRGSQGVAGAAQNVKVFFRLWGTINADTDWNPAYTYLSNTDSGGNPLWPEAPADSHTIPFFATSNRPDFSDPTNPEYGTNGVNNQTITINQGDAQWVYFGCFLNLYDPEFIVNGTQVQHLLSGDHHCIVAEIAYAGAPIENVAGITMSPETSDKLAQRNLQVTLSDNPGDPATHLIPQTFDTRFSPPFLLSSGTLPDELMIDWGNVPDGCLAHIYWPQASAQSVVDLSAQMYGVQALSVADPNTVACRTSSDLTYVPIPAGSGEGLAGLLTMDLPPTVIKGQEFNVVIRRIGTRTVQIPPPIPVIQISSDPHARVLASATVPADNGGTTLIERYIVGSYQVKIPVSVRSLILPAEEDRLAIFKARLENLPTSSRWHPVLTRYVKLLESRVDGLGGDGQAVPPSLGGYEPGRGKPGGRPAELTGKVEEVRFDCDGALESFVLEACGRRRTFHIDDEPELRELLLEVCRNRLWMSVELEADRVHRLTVEHRRHRK